MPQTTLPNNNQLQRFQDVVSDKNELVSTLQNFKKWAQKEGSDFSYVQEQ